MFRIDGPTAAPALPAPAAASGTPGYFTSGDPSAPIPPTQVSADWLNMIQEELVAVIAGAGIQPQKNAFNQLFTAIQSLITSGGVAFATDAEAVAGALSNKAVSPRAAAALVANRVSAIVANAPATLSTLDALAAAIGDNPNFAGDMTTALAARALAARRVAASGLASGGGLLTDDITISVQAASGAELNAGTEAGKALTPAAFAAAGGGDGANGWAPLPGGRMIQWGSLMVMGQGSNIVDFTIAFNRPFLNVCGSVVATAEPMAANWHPLAVMLRPPTIAGVSGSIDTTNSDYRFSGARRVNWQAIGQ